MAKEWGEGGGPRGLSYSEQMLRVQDNASPWCTLSDAWKSHTCQVRGGVGLFSRPSARSGYD